MMARLKLDEAFDFDAAEKLVKDALAINPKHVGAFAVRAGIALRDGDLDAANAAIDAGLAVDPADLELLSLRAAARYLADDMAGLRGGEEGSLRAATRSTAAPTASSASTRSGSTATTTSSR